VALPRFNGRSDFPFTLREGISPFSEVSRVGTGNPGPPPGGCFSLNGELSEGFRKARIRIDSALCGRQTLETGISKQPYEDLMS